MPDEGNFNGSRLLMVNIPKPASYQSRRSLQHHRVMGILQKANGKCSIPVRQVDDRTIFAEA